MLGVSPEFPGTQPANLAPGLALGLLETQASKGDLSSCPYPNIASSFLWPRLLLLGSGGRAG